MVIVIVYHKFININYDIIHVYTKHVTDTDTGLQAANDVDSTAKR